MPRNLPGLGLTTGRTGVERDAELREAIGILDVLLIDGCPPIFLYSTDQLVEAAKKLDKGTLQSAIIEVRNQERDLKNNRNSSTNV